ncbi:IS1 family transposase [Flavobacterium sp. SM15]|uniref:IS1 family transposase n=1 Tax=Flavobacterium sp. SM15 TaxID=2908005 RepID=UPI001ED9FA7C|nr:IS1 family transposase [Flavobacterium sp. SM15]MCG2611798.1 IS1 family transposase [Flavobacterium sp. SM15]
MKSSEPLCIRVSDKIKCIKCSSFSVIKNGKTKNQKQQYYCKSCGKRFIEFYSYKAYALEINSQIVTFIKEGLGVRSIARILKISTTTLLKRIVSIASLIKTPQISIGGKYEVDELCTYLGNKNNRIWIVYALHKCSKKVVSFNIGKRTNKTISKVIDFLKLSNAKKIFTDRLQNYRSLIENHIHSVKRYGTNHIERKNLTLRTHLKRLNRKTICFGRSLIITFAVLKIYFWF